MTAYCPQCRKEQEVYIYKTNHYNKEKKQAEIWKITVCKRCYAQTEAVKVEGISNGKKIKKAKD